MVHNNDDVTTVNLTELDLKAMEGKFNTPAEHKLFGFALWVHRIFPRCSFAPTRDSRKWYVYHENKPMTMGWIGYGNFRNSGGEDCYVVGSRHIRNGRYSNYSNQHFMMMVKDVKKATKNASKFLREYTPKEIADLHRSRISNQHNDVLADKTHEVGKLSRALVDGHNRHDRLYVELKALHDIGHKFSNPDFQERVAKLVKAREESEEYKRNRSNKMFMVSIEGGTNGNNSYGLAVVPDITDRNIPTEHMGSYSPEDLQEPFPDMVGKTAVLRMCEDGQWVDEVGSKISDQIYYVVG